MQDGSESVSWDESQNCIPDSAYLTTESQAPSSTKTTTTTTTHLTSTTAYKTTKPTTLPFDEQPPTQQNCTLTSFKCRTGECIPDILKCNGIMDCPYGEDERNPDCHFGNFSLSCDKILKCFSDTLTPYPKHLRLQQLWHSIIVL